MVIGSGKNRVYDLMCRTVFEEEEHIPSRLLILLLINIDFFFFFGDSDDDSTKLTTKLRRVWQERGDFSQLTIEKIESSPSQADGSDTSDEIDETPKSVEDSNLSKSITVDELWEMKTKMAQHLR